MRWKPYEPKTALNKYWKQYLVVPLPDGTKAIKARHGYITPHTPDASWLLATISYDDQPDKLTSRLSSLQQTCNDGTITWHNKTELQYVFPEHCLPILLEILEVKKKQQYPRRKNQWHTQTYQRATPTAATTANS